MLRKIALVIGSALLGALVFILVRETATELTAASMFGFPAPVAGLALAFPALYMAWEQSET